MGGTSSKTETQVATDIATNVIVNDVQNCASFVAQDQVLNITGSGNITQGVKFVQACTINMDCYRKARNIVDLQNMIINAIQQNAKATASGFPTLDAGTKSSDVTKITNAVRSNVTMDMIQNCVAAVNQRQALNITGNRNITMDIAFDQTASQLKSCLSDTLNQSNFANSFKADVTQEASSETKSPFSFITDIFGGMFNTVILIVGAIVLIIVASMMGGGGGGDSYSEQPPQYQQYQPQYYPQNMPNPYGQGPVMAAAPAPAYAPAPAQYTPVAPTPAPAPQRGGPLVATA
jgi:hypothetical protein